MDGAVYRQKAVSLYLHVSGHGGAAELGFSGSCAGGAAYGGNALGDGTRNLTSLISPTPVASPIPGSNLLVLRESLITGATGMSTTLERVLGVFV